MPKDNDELYEGETVLMDPATGVRVRTGGAEERATPLTGDAAAKNRRARGLTPAQQAFEPDRMHAAALRMEDEGGGFACAIANAYFRADRENKARLLAAFGELFEQYAPK